MSSPTQKSVDDPAVAGCSSEHTPGPSIHIQVEHLLGESAPSRFRFTGRDAERIEVDDQGEIRIDWKAVDRHARLMFELTSPAVAYLDGFMMGWRQGGLLNLVPLAMSYRVSAEGGGSGSAVRAVALELDRNPGIAQYRLHVAYPDGTTDAIDPKIYNQGDGVGDDGGGT